MADLQTARRLAARERTRADALAVIADGEDRFGAVVATAFRAVFGPVVEAFATARTAGGEGFASADDLAVIRTAWAAEVDGRLAPLVAEMYDVGTLATLLRFDTAVEARRADAILDALDDVLDRRAAAYLDTASNRLVGIGDTAWATARDTLAEGFRAGEAVEDLSARVETALSVAENRAVTIARTEVVAASNAGATDGARVLGDYGPTHKQWLATLDPRTRESHADADGQVVPIADTFDVGGSSLDFPGDPAGPPEEVVNCRCTVLFVDDPDATIDPTGRQTGYPEGASPDDLAAAAAPHHEETTMARRSRTFRAADGTAVPVPPPPRANFAEGDPVAPGAETPPAGDPAAPPAPAPEATPAPPVGEDLTIAVPEGVNVRPFEVVLAVEGRWTGDDRYLLPGAVRWDGMLPLPLTADHVDDVDSVLGLVGEVSRVPGPNPGENLIVGRGLFDLGNMDRANDLALQVVDRIESGALRGVSIRVDDETLGGVDPSTLEPGEDEWWMYVVEDCRLRALSVTPVQAFAEGVITLDPEGIDLTTLPPAPTGPVAVTAEEADALRDAIAEEIETLIDEVGAPLIIAGGGAYTLVAAGPGPLAPPVDLFADPHLSGPTPLTIEEPDADGIRRVFGHLATWGTCHTGFEGQCITPPHSATGYAAFRTGEVLCANGERVAVGRLTLGTGHASTRLAARPAVEHYDNTGAAVADVAAGEDAHGVWVAGVVRPTVTDEDVAVMRSSPPSGDWRRIGTSMELVAALHVNVPGFPVPRSRVASGVPQALVAAGAVGTGRRVAALDGAAERIAATIGRDRRSIVAGLVERVHGTD